MKNPLSNLSDLKHFAVPFNQIQPEHFVPALEEAIAFGRKTLAEIKTKPASYQNTILGLEIATERADYVANVYGNLLSALSTPEIQALMTQVGPKRAEFSNDLWLDSEIFAKVKEAYEKRDSAGLNQEQKYFIEKVYRDFTKSGANLPEEKKARLREIDQRLSQIVPQFRQNVTSDINAFELWITDVKEVPGLTEAHLEAAKADATAKGKPEQWLFTLQMPSVMAILKFCANRSIREQILKADRKRAFGGKNDNQPLILEEIALAKEKANILGFKTYADMILDDRMAQNTSTVNQFIEKIIKAALPVAKKEVAEVAEFARKKDGITELQAWDFAYYAEKLKEEKYAFDEASLKPYFKLENVVKGAFEHASKLFDLTFVKKTDYPVYHPEVEVFEVYKHSASGPFVGLLYADWFPRDTKNAGAWMTMHKEQMLNTGAGTNLAKLDRPHVGIVCNFTKPTATKPSLLTYDEVLTLFHEFGHALHGLLSQCEVRSLAGTNVYWDFVELPSQIMENWLQEEEALRLFAKHYETGEPIPTDLVKKIQQSDLYLTGYQTMRQLTFASLDMSWFTTDPKTITSVPEFEKKAIEHLQLLPSVPGTNSSCSFSHIFGGGYSSGYYSYKWAEALDADAFEYFKEKGIYNREVAEKFEKHILSKGGSDHPMRLYENFRGRKPDPDALLRKSGLVNIHG